MKKILLFCLFCLIAVTGVFAQNAYVITSQRGLPMVPIFSDIDVWDGTCTLEANVAAAGAKGGTCLAVSTKGVKGWWGMGQRAQEANGSKTVDLTAYNYLVVRMMYPADRPYSSSVMIGFSGREGRGSNKMEKDADGGRQQIRKKVRISKVNDGKWHTYVIDLSKHKKKLKTSFTPFIMLFASTAGRGTIYLDEVYYTTALPTEPYEMLK